MTDRVNLFNPFSHPRFRFMPESLVRNRGSVHDHFVEENTHEEERTA